jgi:hypothetical protein
MEIEKGFRNLLCNQHNPGSPQQGRETQQNGRETALSAADQLLTSIKQERRESKNVTRHKAVIEKRMKADLDRNTNAASVLSKRELFSNISTDDSGCAIPTRKSGVREKRIRFYTGKGKKDINLAGEGTSLRTTQEPEVEVENSSVPAQSNFTSQAGELEAVTTKTKTQDKPQAYSGDEMDVEMSGRIAKLEI